MFVFFFFFFDNFLCLYSLISKPVQLSLDERGDFVTFVPPQLSACYSGLELQRENELCMEKRIRALRRQLLNEPGPAKGFGLFTHI